MSRWPRASRRCWAPSPEHRTPKATLLPAARRPTNAYQPLRKKSQVPFTTNTLEERGVLVHSREGTPRPEPPHGARPPSSVRPGCRLGAQRPWRALPTGSLPGVPGVLGLHKPPRILLPETCPRTAEAGLAPTKGLPGCGGNPGSVKAAANVLQKKCGELTPDPADRVYLPQKGAMTKRVSDLCGRETVRLWFTDRPEQVRSSDTEDAS